MNSRYPVSLIELIQINNNYHKQLVEKDLLDTYGNKVIYIPIHNKIKVVDYVLFSSGIDGIPFNVDDYYARIDKNRRKSIFHIKS